MIRRNIQEVLTSNYTFCLALSCLHFLFLFSFFSYTHVHIQQASFLLHCIRRYRKKKKNNNRRLARNPTWMFLFFFFIFFSHAECHLRVVGKMKLLPKIFSREFIFTEKTTIDHGRWFYSLYLLFFHEFLSKNINTCARSVLIYIHVFFFPISFIFLFIYLFSYILTHSLDHLLTTVLIFLEIFLTLDLRWQFQTNTTTRS